MPEYYSQLIAVGLFLAFVFLVYYLTFRSLWDRMWGKPPRGRLDRCLRSRTVTAFLMAAVVVGSGCIFYGFFIEPQRLVVTHYTVATPKLPKGARIRIVHIADLHTRTEGVRERKLPGLVAALEPDLILHTGDFFSKTDASASAVEKLLRSLQAPQFACMGNLDGYADFDGVLKRAGAVALDGAAQSVTVGAYTLSLTGFPSGAVPLMHRALQTLSADTFNIVLYHHPDGFPEIWNTNADLMLAGHTHGGQVRLPFYGALVTLDRYGKRFEYGRYTEEGKTLIVSRGIGCEPGLPELRFLCAPEVVVIDVVGEGTGVS